MAFRKWNAVIEELRVQRERSEREFALNRRTYEKGMELCAHLIERSAAASDEHSRVVAENSLVVHELVDVIREMREDLRANTRATVKVIDRMDRLDGGAQPA
jgi:hypothetical protein